MIPLPQGVRRIDVGMAELWFGRGAVRLCTVLGSCVAVCLYHRARALGGLCHVVLPRRSPHTPLTTAPDPRYMDEALNILDEKAAIQGLALHQFEVRVFGGGDMFGGQSRITVGQQNIEAARCELKARRIHIQAEHVGGLGHRKLAFDLWDGRIWLLFPGSGQGLLPEEASGLRQPIAF
jgi:chemotaxis protein CheD